MIVMPLDAIVACISAEEMPVVLNDAIAAHAGADIIPLRTKPLLFLQPCSIAEAARHGPPIAGRVLH